MDLTKLSDPQREAVEHIDGPILVLAGAGSGKTRVVTYRIAHMIENCGISAGNILAITFTNKAAREMKERAMALLSNKADAPQISTFHSLCCSILQRNYRQLGFRKRPLICDAEDSKKRITNICKLWNVDKMMISIIIGIISKTKDEMTSIEKLYAAAHVNEHDKAIINETDPKLISLYTSQLDKEKIPALVYSRYQQDLEADQMLDFDDMVPKTVLLMQQNPDILELLQESYKYVSVDEYQDVSFAQVEFVKLLTAKYRNILAVGDDYQSIYGFRNSDVKYILNFKEMFHHAKIVTLGQNYRSTQTIVNASSAVIRNNHDQMHKKTFSENEKGHPIVQKEFDNSYGEAAYIAKIIEVGIKTGNEPKDYAILYRKNAMSRSFEDKLIKAKIPYIIYGGISFYQRMEVKDIVAYLNIIAGSEDRIALERIINVPKRGIGNKMFERIQEQVMRENVSLWDAVVNISNENKKLQPFVELIETLRSKAEILSVSDLIKEIIYDTQYEEYLKTISEKADEPDKDYETRIEDIWEVVNKAKEYEKELGSNDMLTTFLNDISLLTDADRQNAGNNVCLMTLHGAKGLEFPNVFMPGMEEGIFPDGKDPLEITEDRRLCYVGMTRAKETLMMSSCQFRNLYGRTTAMRPSRFLAEVPKEYVKCDRTQCNTKENEYEMY